MLPVVPAPIVTVVVPASELPITVFCVPVALMLVGPSTVTVEPLLPMFTAPVVVPVAMFVVNTPPLSLIVTLPSVFKAPRTFVVVELPPMATTPLLVPVLILVLTLLLTFRLRPPVPLLRVVVLVPFELPRLTVLAAAPVPIEIVCGSAPEPIVVVVLPMLLISTLPLLESTSCVAVPLLNVSAPPVPTRTKRVDVIALSPFVSLPSRY